MKAGSKHDLLCVFKLVAIWFDNESQEDIRAIVEVILLIYFSVIDEL